MVRTVWAVGSLLLSVGILLFGHGMHLTLMPLMAEQQGWSTSLNALTTSAYFLGFGAGCVVIPNLLARIGHIRVFGVLVATTTASLLALPLLPYAPAWLILRLVYGIAISGIYLTVESWLNAETTTEYRGTVLAVYSFVTLIAIFGAQLVLQALLIDHLRLVAIAAIFLATAALPIGLTRRAAPPTPASPRLNVDLLSRASNLPALVNGVLTGTFWALAPLMIARLGFAADGVARFMAITVGAGMLAVYPLGWLSDRLGRVAVIGGLGVGGVAVTLAFLLFLDRSEGAVMVYGAAFGAIVMPLYALSLALANDYADGANFVETGSVVIMANAAGMVLGPIAGGLVLVGSSIAPLLWFWIAAFVALGFSTLPLRRQPIVGEAHTNAFELVPRSVPEALVIDPRADVQAAEQTSKPGGAPV